MNRKVFSSVAVFALASSFMIGVAGCGSGEDETVAFDANGSFASPSPFTSPSPVASPSPSPSPASSPAGTVTTASGLQYQDLTVGTGATAASGGLANVTYIGTLTDGTEFDRGTFSFTLGANQVVAGFDEGVTGMKVGGRRRLTIPSNLGYGIAPPADSGIPVNATLIFDVTLNSVAIP